MFESLFGKKGYQDISQKDAKEKLSAYPHIVLLDVRTPEEYREIHIPNSISLPLPQLKSGIEETVKNREAEIFVYCLSGARAASACRQLAEMGYTHVSNMGGIRSWKYETEAGR